jgi:hypothetical protein
MSRFDDLAQEFLAQERIAVAGVSRTEEATANFIYKKLRDSGRQVFALNPNAETVEGDPCYPNLGAIPGGVDGVLIVTKPEISEQIARDAAAAGVPRLWMHGNGFAASSVSEKATALCRENGITVIDGGCPMMFFDFGHKCMKWMLKVMGRLP